MSVKWVMVFAIAMVLLTAESPTEAAHRPTLTQNDPEMESLVTHQTGVKTIPSHGGKVCKKGPHSNCKPPQNDAEMESSLTHQTGDKTTPAHGRKGCKKGSAYNCKPPHI